MVDGSDGMIGPVSNETMLSSLSLPSGVSDENNIDDGCDCDEVFSGIDAIVTRLASSTTKGATLWPVGCGSDNGNVDFDSNNDCDADAVAGSDSDLDVADEDEEYDISVAIEW